MRFLPDPAGNRRDFFRATARYSLLGLLSLAGILTARKGGLRGQTCINNGICGACTAFPDCSLPQALSAREGKVKS
jgi:hypothetical protein